MSEASYAERARSRKYAEALAMGIDDTLIDHLVEGFYANCRRDDLLGPIFESHVSDWPSHLARMKDFWAAVTLESGRYHGNPMMKHIAVGGLDERHFERWLHIWHETIDAIVPQQAAARLFRDAAGRIASSLLMGIRIDRGDSDVIAATKSIS